MVDYLRITSKDNPIIKKISGLQRSSKDRKNAGLFVLEGLRLCTDALVNGFRPETVVISDSALKKYEKNIISLTNNTCEKVVIPDCLFEKISDTVSPQGILCLFKIPYFDPSSVKREGKYVALENLQDPSNLGAISRTAEALGIDGLILYGGCDPYSPKSLRASMGALLRIPVVETDKPFEVINTAKLRSYAAVVSGAKALVGKVEFVKGSVVFIGNEANGLTDETVSKCDEKVTIPMIGRAESLNAGVAASIIMWEMSKC